MKSLIFTFLLSIGAACFAIFSPVLAIEQGGGDRDQKAVKALPLSPVQKLVFDQFHLKNVMPGQTLHYLFERKGVFGDDYTDKIDLFIKGGAAEARTVGFRFFSGNRRRPYQDLTEVTSNPLLVLYFNKDVWDLARRIKARGVANYLRNRILDGMGKAKEITKSVCVLAGREVPGQRIVFEPYGADENRHHLVHYSGIRYEIVLSDAVPGALCEIRTVVPYPEEKTPAHFLAKLKKSGMFSLAEEVEKVNKLTQTAAPLFVERLVFDRVSRTGREGD